MVLRIFLSGNPGTRPSSHTRWLDLARGSPRVSPRRNLLRDAVRTAAPVLENRSRHAHHLPVRESPGDANPGLLVLRHACHRHDDSAVGQVAVEVGDLDGRPGDLAPAGELEPQDLEGAAPG